jgi:HD-like signal output (HDOD) protein
VTTSAVRAQLVRVFRTPGYVPPVLPKVAIELLALSRRSDVAIPQIVRLLEQDALIAAAVLRKAQSAFFTRKAPVQSLHEAIVRLGLDTVRDLFFGVAVTSKVFRAKGYEEPMNRLRRHATATAHVARLVCRHTGIYDEYAFLCGLLHDAGMAASLIALSASAQHGEPTPPLESAWPAVDEMHVEAGEVLCTLWKLPSDVSYVIGTHHNPRQSSPVHPLAAAVASGEAIAVELGCGMTGEATETPAWASQAISLSSSVRASIATEAKDWLAAIE